MRILINTSVINQGGAFQVALNLIRHTMLDKSHNYHYIISQELAASDFLDLEGQSVTITEKSPANILTARKTRQQIKAFEKEVGPDVVYSVGAPSYIKFKNIEVLRLTNPFVIGADALAYSTLNSLERLDIGLRIWLRRQFVGKKQFMITQTLTAKKNIVNNFGTPEVRVKVVPNTYSPIFAPKKLKTFGSPVQILCLAAPYPHKNLSLVPMVASELIKMGITDFRFVITVPKEMKNSELTRLNGLVKKHNLDNYVVNIGRVNMEECPKLYEESDIVFLPTLLEVFSATHIEAMAMRVPIVTTDLDFCHEICQDGALYFEPKNHTEAAKKILNLISNKELRDCIKLNQDKIIKELPKTEDIYEMHIMCLEEFMRE